MICLIAFGLRIYHPDKLGKAQNYLDNAVLQTQNNSTVQLPVMHPWSFALMYLSS